MFDNMEIIKDNKIDLNNGEKFYYTMNKEGNNGYCML